MNALIESDLVEVLADQPETVSLPTPSGAGQSVLRCPSCRVALWSHYGRVGDRVSFVRVGTLDEPHPIRPDIHIYTSTKQPWVMLNDEVPIVDEYYEAKIFWPPDSLMRLREAVKRA